jgi:hypothetical protein
MICIIDKKETETNYYVEEISMNKDKFRQGEKLNNTSNEFVTGYSYCNEFEGKESRKTCISSVKIWFVIRVSKSFLGKVE